jgi:D-arginine dehydrogenase
MDVAAIHQCFVRGMRRAGAEIRTSAPLVAAEPAGARVSVRVGDETLEVDLVVNAAGAWGDVVAQNCGVTPVGLQPLRRTAFMVPGRAEARTWPLVVDVDHLWYFKPDGEQFLCSPADETLCHPCDARPQEVDIALAIERINAATHLGIRSVRASWAGLRTFAPDRAMVIGPDPDHPWFVWLVGQGGTGIQTAPAAGRLAACLALGQAPPGDLLDEGLDLAALSPARFRSETSAGKGVP